MQQMNDFHPVGIPDDMKEKVRAFNECEYAQLNQIEITDVWEGGARAVMDVAGKMNPFGVVHGGAIFALADQVFAISANQTDVVEVALNARINYISAAKGRLEAISRRIAETACCSIYDIRIMDGERLVAQFEGITYKMR
ncbi:MAG: PaaI family thioesterase [Methanomicrobiales archaeon]|nr:PaaI family thioesterase [Methanomicrobiales archaeon]